MFEVALSTDGELRSLQAEVRALLEDGDDCRFYCLCKACRGRSMDATGERVACPPAAVVL